jgi:alcohol dehydrogenase
MQALVFEQFQSPLSLQEVTDPVVPRDGVVIGVRASGLCRSDWHGWMGHDADIRLPHVPGHELAGVVEEVGADVERFRPGDRVTVPFSVGCGHCAACLARQQQVCENYFQPGFTSWGSFAQRVAIPHADWNLVRLPTQLDFVSAASLGCRYATSYHALTAQGQLRPGQWLVVYGCGGVGLSAIQIGATLGARVLAVDVNRQALEWARRNGAVHTLVGQTSSDRTDELISQVRELTGGGAHVSLDAVGTPLTCQQSVLGLRTRGCHVQVGLLIGPYRQTPLPMHLVVARELRIAGSHGMSATDYRPLLKLIVDGRLDPGALVAERVGLAEIAERLPRLADDASGGISVAVI